MSLKIGGKSMATIRKFIPISQRRSVPLRKIEKMIELAKKHSLRSLKVGDVTIVPSFAAPTQDPLLKRPTERDGRKLNERQVEDMILFGPNGVLDNG